MTPILLQLLLNFLNISRNFNSSVEIHKIFSADIYRIWNIRNITLNYVPVCIIAAQKP